MTDQPYKTVRSIQRVTSWSEVLAGQAMLAKRVEVDAEIFSWLINMRIELTAALKLLQATGVSLDDLNKAVEIEANDLNHEFEERFPGLEAIETDDLPEPPGNGSRLN